MVPSENSESWQRLRDALDNSSKFVAGLRVPMPLLGWAVPATVGNFVNRAEPVAEVRRRAESGRSRPEVMAFEGHQGSGKSQLLYRCAEALRDLFDLVIHVELVPRSPGGEVAMDDVLGGVLERLGVDRASIPADLSGRRHRLLALTESRRVLVLIDGVSEAAQVSVLTPNSPHALVIAVGNPPLNGLTLDGATVRYLSGLDAEYGLELLSAFVGPERVRAESEAAERLVAICSGSPLGLKILGEQLLGQPDLPLRQLVGELDARTSTAGPQATRSSARAKLIAVVDSSYQLLDDDVAVLYRALGSAPADRWPTESIAALLADSDVDIQAALGQLIGHNLLERHDGGYAMPGLVRIHARAAALAADPEDLRSRRRARMVDAWLSLAASADRAVTVARLRLGPAPTATPGQTGFATPHDAMKWFDRWHIVLLEVLREASAQRLDQQVWRLFETTWPFYTSRSFHQEWLEAGGLAVEAAQRCGDARAEARMRCLRSRASRELGLHDDAAADISTAHRLTEATDLTLLASVLDFDGQLHYHQGNVVDALKAFEHSLAINERIGDRRGVALQSQFCGRCLTQLGQYEKALGALDRAAELITPFADHRAESRILFSRAEALRGLHRPDRAVTALNQALERAAALGTTDLMLPPLRLLADLAHDAGDSTAELEYLRKLLEVLAVTGATEEQERVQTRIDALAD